MSRRVLRVTVVAPLPPPYGGIAHWTQLMLRYANTRTDVELRVIDISPRWRVVDDLADWKRIAGGGIQLLRDYRRFVHQLSARVHRPHVVHLTTSGQLATMRDLAMLRTANLLRVPVVYHLHFGRVRELAWQRSGEWLRLAQALRLAHTVLVLDGQTEQAIRQRLPNVRVARIPNCLDFNSLPMPTEEPEGNRSALFLGWVLPAKGIAELLDAWTQLRPAGWKLRIIGPGRKSYQSRLTTRYCPYATDFLGESSRKEAMRVLAGVSLFVLPSHTEAFPIVVLEAMALGKPIIATKVGAIPEMLQEDCGLLVEPRDMASLREALAVMTCDAELRQRMGARACIRAHREYTVNKVFPRYVDIWQDACGLF